MFSDEPGRTKSKMPGPYRHVTPAIPSYRCRHPGSAARLAVSAEGPTFELAGDRATYLPRINVSKSDRLYTGRSVSAEARLAFFIDFLLRRGEDNSSCPSK